VIERYKTVSIEDHRRGSTITSTTTTSLDRRKDGGCKADLVSVSTTSGTVPARSVASLDFSRLNPVPRIEEQSVASTTLRSIRLRSSDGSKSIPASVSGRVSTGDVLGRLLARGAGSSRSSPMVDFVDVPSPSAIAAQELAAALTEVIAACQTSRGPTGLH
jgi:hypothetical protein